MIDLKAKPKPVKEMYGEYRSKSKIFRLTELQLEQLEQHLEKEQTTFTDFILSLIQGNYERCCNRKTTRRRTTTEDQNQNSGRSRQTLQKTDLIYCLSYPKSATT